MSETFTATCLGDYDSFCGLVSTLEDPAEPFECPECESHSAAFQIVDGLGFEKPGDVKQHRGDSAEDREHEDWNRVSRSSEKTCDGRAYTKREEKNGEDREEELADGSLDFVVGAHLLLPLDGVCDSDELGENEGEAHQNQSRENKPVLSSARLNYGHNEKHHSCYEDQRLTIRNSCHLESQFYCVTVSAAEDYNVPGRFEAFGLIFHVQLAGRIGSSVVVNAFKVSFENGIFRSITVVHDFHNLPALATIRRWWSPHLYTVPTKFVSENVDFENCVGAADDVLVGPAVSLVAGRVDSVSITTLAALPSSAVANRKVKSEPSDNIICVDRWKVGHLSFLDVFSEGFALVEFFENVNVDTFTAHQELVREHELVVGYPVVLAEGIGRSLSMRSVKFFDTDSVHVLAPCFLDEVCGEVQRVAFLSIGFPDFPVKNNFEYNRVPVVIVVAVVRASEMLTDTQNFRVLFFLYLVRHGYSRFISSLSDARADISCMSTFSVNQDRHSGPTWWTFTAWLSIPSAVSAAGMRMAYPSSLQVYRLRGKPELLLVSHFPFQRADDCPGVVFLGGRSEPLGSHEPDDPIEYRRGLVSPTIFPAGLQKLVKQAESFSSNTRRHNSYLLTCLHYNSLGDSS